VGMGITGNDLFSSKTWLTCSFA